MITEFRTLYRGTDNETGLEVAAWAGYLRNGVAHLLCSDIDGQVLDVPASQIKLNWRWNANSGWIDLDDKPIADE